MDSFDYIIVGGGSAASVLAYRLSEDPNCQICVLEAGPPDNHPAIRMPAGFVKTIFNPNYTWQFSAEPSEGTAGRRIPISQGRTLGGSSSINGAVINRGQVEDFNDWAALGNQGWSYADVLPYFRRFEQRLGPGDDRFRGRDGRLPVSTLEFPNRAAEAFVAAAKAQGFPATPDYNGETHEGVGIYQSAIRNGRRVSAAHAYLHPAARRSNVSVRTKSEVTRILFEGRRATGVEFRRDGSANTHRIVARRGVILAAGALNSPRLLQLSGVGPGEVLRQAGIPVFHELPGVGENLQDHYNGRLVARARRALDSFNSRLRGPALALEFIRWIAGRPSVLGLSPVLAHLFGRSRPSLDRANFSLLFFPASMQRIGVLDDLPGFTWGPWLMRPESRGSVRVTSSDANLPPTVQPNYLSAEADRHDMVEVLRVTRSIVSSKEMGEVVAEETLPGPGVQTDDEWLDFARRYGGTAYHFCGTCKMGPEGDAGAVVDSGLRVHGIQCLYVVDASVMPRIVSANTYASTLMIAEKATDMIMGKVPR
jgi:choline dehydrogenase